MTTEEKINNFLKAIPLPSFSFKCKLDTESLRYFCVVKKDGVIYKEIIIGDKDIIDFDHDRQTGQVTKDFLTLLANYIKEEIKNS